MAELEPPCAFLFGVGYAEVSGFQYCFVVHIIAHVRSDHRLEVFIKYHLKMFIRLDFLPIGGFFGEGTAVLHFDGGKSQCQCHGHRSVIAVGSVKCRVAVPHPFVQ